MGYQIIELGFSDLFSGIPYSKAFVVNVHVGEAIEFHVELLGSVPSEKRMCMGINESR